MCRGLIPGLTGGPLIDEGWGTQCCPCCFVRDSDCHAFGTERSFEMALLKKCLEFCFLLTMLFNYFVITSFMKKDRKASSSQQTLDYLDGTATMAPQPSSNSDPVPGNPMRPDCTPLCKSVSNDRDICCSFCFECHAFPFCTSLSNDEDFLFAFCSDCHVASLKDTIYFRIYFFHTQLWCVPNSSLSKCRIFVWCSRKGRKKVKVKKGYIVRRPK